MTAPDIIKRWKSPLDFEQWLARHFERWVSHDLRTPGAAIDDYSISTPGLTATFVSKNFPAVRAWGLSWQQAADSAADICLECEDWTTRDFGRVRLPRSARVTSIDGVARLLKKSGDLSAARRRCATLIGDDAQLSQLTDYWRMMTAMPEPDFNILCRFVKLIPHLPVVSMRLREVACEGMHTKFLEQNRGLVAPIMTALGLLGKANAKTWAGRLGFIDDESAMFELRDLDGSLLPYPYFALPASAIIENPLVEKSSARLFGVVVVENLATFRALPSIPGVIAIFGSGDAVRGLAFTGWLAGYPLLYAGDLDHAGFQMVAALRRDGLSHLETAFMDAATATCLRSYWVTDTSRPGSGNAYVGLTEGEHEAQQMMAEGPWRLEQERIAYDTWVGRLRAWRGDGSLMKVST